MNTLIATVILELQEQKEMGKDIELNTPVMKQFLEVKSKYKDSIILFRMGDFYETFLDDAIITSKILGIVLTKRANGKAAHVDLAGFPHHALDNYLPKLVKAGHRVAICEQVEDPKLAKGIVKREVVEVITPGTLTGDQALNDRANRFIGSICSSKENSGFSFLDSSTGELYIGECHTNVLNNLFLKFRPHEIIVSEEEKYSTSKWYMEFQPFMSRVSGWMFDYDTSHHTLIKHFEVKNLKGYGCGNMTLGVCASGALVNHIKSDLSSSLNHVSKLIPVAKDGIMGLDAFTVKNLEIFQSLSSQGVHGTLIDCLDITQTSIGGRLLRQWLINPSTDLNKIELRHNTVEVFTKEKNLLKLIVSSLSNCSDIQRILGKVNQGKSTPRELLSLADTMGKIPEWQNELSKTKNQFLLKISKSFIEPKNIVDRIKNIINENAPIHLSQGNVINGEVDTELDELRILLKNGKDWINNFQDKLRTDLQIPKLKVGFNKIFGYYIEVTKTHQNKIPDTFIRKQTLVNSERYITDDLKMYEEKILNAEEKILEIESDILIELCNFILSEKNMIQMNALVISRLDLFTSFATLSIKNNYVKPILTNDKVLKIKEGRHPVVERLLPSTEKFIPNDITMHADVNQIHLLTGPNMAGKSTYLRQLGLIVIMAQIGCFVPAKSATLGVTDKLFTRVGASDNLAGGESTFLVEMNEASNILNNATDKSLILLDEVGRGTSTYDGLSLAWAITEYLHNTEGMKARTIFATHYHELTVLENSLERLENHHVEVKEFGDSIIFMRTIEKGPGDKSYGIQVAKMAGLPKIVVQRAEHILAHHIDAKLNDKRTVSIESYDQLTFFNEQDSKIIKKLKKINLDSMTPIEAIKYLDELKKEYNL